MVVDSRLYHHPQTIVNRPKLAMEMSSNPAGRDLSPSFIPKKEFCVYTKCYCEENVWKLCEYVQKEHMDQLSNCYAVFISNARQAVPIWHQQACQSVDNPVVWDYHVIFLYSDGQRSTIYDLDTKMAFPIDFDIYVAHSIRLDEALKEEYHRLFRVVSASDFLLTFSSDRSHMCREDNSWISTPPDYPCIQAGGVSTNLQEFTCMEAGTGNGEVMTLNQFVDRFGDLNNYHKLAMHHYNLCIPPV